ncbi:MAG TPA: hypothetical protein VK469_08315 [Candidatus Kapabacteria bacterium]|nr:hypothetical protein [Candidatus Kapabacteria bacterium]
MSIYQDVLFVGGHGGQPFSASGLQCAFIRSIRIWKDKFDGHSMIKAIEVLFTDGITQSKFGNSKGEVDAEFTFNEGERFESLSLWGNGNGKRLGRIKFKTTDGREFDTGKCDGKDEYTAIVGSGLCVGIEGNSGADIDQLGFKFIKAIGKMELTNVEYPSLAFDTSSIKEVSLANFSDKNGSMVEKQWEFKNSIEETTERTWSTTFNVELWGQFSVTAGVPEISEVTGTFGWKVGSQQNFERKTESKITLEWSNSGSLKPGESINLEAITRQGNLSSLEMKGNLEITTVDKKFVSIPITGFYKGIDYSKVDIITKL